MTTLATLKAEIASDLYRDDLTSDIATKITSAIRYYNRQRFYWNTLTTSTFPLVVSQSKYDASDAAFIANIVRIDALFLETDDARTELGRVSPIAIETALGANPDDGEPSEFCYADQAIRFDVGADDTYDVIVHGVIAVAGPATDDEANNPWMIEGYDLIKHRALAMLYAESLHDTEMGNVHKSLEADELNTIVGETNLRSGTGELTPTEF